MNKNVYTTSNQQPFSIDLKYIELMEQFNKIVNDMHKGTKYLITFNLHDHGAMTKSIWLNLNTEVLI